VGSGRGGGRSLLGRLGGIRGGIGLLFTVDEMPFAVDDASARVGKEFEETTRKVETTPRAPRALVHDGGSGAQSAERDADLFTTRGIWVIVLLNG